MQIRLRNTSVIRSLFLISLVVSLLLLIGCGKKTNRTTKVTVAGEAVTRVEPDTAVVSLSVVTQSPQALTAQQKDELFDQFRKWQEGKVR